jgi:hypothetical protein
MPAPLAPSTDTLILSPPPFSDKSNLVHGGRDHERAGIAALDARGSTQVEVGGLVYSLSVELGTPFEAPGLGKYPVHSKSLNQGVVSNRGRL